MIKRHFKQLKSTAYLKLFNWCINYFCPYLYSNELVWKKYRSVDIHHFTAFELWYRRPQKKVGSTWRGLELQAVVLSGCSSGSWLWLMTLIFPPIDINAIGSFDIFVSYKLIVIVCQFLARATSFPVSISEFPHWFWQSHKYVFFANWHVFVW